MAIRSLIVTCLLLSRTCPAATVTIDGSVLGFFFDPTQGLQPILGVTGSSTIGAPIDLQMPLTSVAISPQQDYALAATSSSTGLMQVTLGSSVSIAPFGVPVQPALIMALSPSGSAAALYDGLQNRIEVISGLPAAPALAQEVDVSIFPGSLTSLAVSDAADAILANFSGVLIGLGPDGSVHPFPAVQQAAAAAFLIGSRDALIADSGQNSMYLVRDVLGSTDPTLLASNSDGISNPVAVAVSKDNETAVVAVAVGVATISLADGTVTLTSCPCQPSGLAALNGNAVFRLTEPSGGPIWLFDGDAPQPRIVFVPPYQGSSQSSAEAGSR